MKAGAGKYFFMTLCVDNTDDFCVVGRCSQHKTTHQFHQGRPTLPSHSGPFSLVIIHGVMHRVTTTCECVCVSWLGPDLRQCGSALLPAVSKGFPTNSCKHTQAAPHQKSICVLALSPTPRLATVAKLFILQENKLP